MAESTTVLMGGGEATTAMDEVPINKTAKVIASILVKAVAEVVCTDNPSSPGAKYGSEKDGIICAENYHNLSLDY